RDVELPVADEPEIAGTQERAGAGCQTSVKRLGGFVGAVPISVGHARTAYPDLADLVRRTRRTPLGMNDDDLLPRRRAHGYVAAGILAGAGCELDATLLDRGSKDPARLRNARRAAGDKDGRLCQPVAGEECRCTKAAPGKSTG